MRRLKQLHDLVARAKGALLAALEKQQQVGLADRLHAMRDENDGLAALCACRRWRRQRFVAGAVEVGVWLVEHDERRIAEQRAGEADALALAAGQIGAEGAELGVVALRQGEDQVVRVRLLGGFDDRPRRRRRRGSGQMFWRTVPANSSTLCGR